MNVPILSAFIIVMFPMTIRTASLSNYNRTMLSNNQNSVVSHDPVDGTNGNPLQPFENKIDKFEKPVPVKSNPVFSYERYRRQISRDDITSKKRLMNFNEIVQENIKNDCLGLLNVIQTSAHQNVSCLIYMIRKVKNVRNMSCHNIADISKNMSSAIQEAAIDVITKSLSIDSVEHWNKIRSVAVIMEKDYPDLFHKLVDEISNFKSPYLEKWANESDRTSANDAPKHTVKDALVLLAVFKKLQIAKELNTTALKKLASRMQKLTMRKDYVFVPTKLKHFFEKNLLQASLMNKFYDVKDLPENSMTNSGLRLPLNVFEMFVLIVIAFVLKGILHFMNGRA